MGSHKEDQLKRKDSGNTRGGEDRGRRRDRTRSKSRETEEDRSKKKGRDKSPYPSEALRRVTSENQQGTDRDSDPSDDQDSLKERGSWKKHRNELKRKRKKQIRQEELGQ